MSGIYIFFEGKKSENLVELSTKRKEKVEVKGNARSSCKKESKKGQKKGKKS